MKNRLAIAISAVLLITACAVFALARTGDPTGFDSIAAQAASKEGHPFIRRMMNRIADRLNLTDEQRQQVKTILENERPTVEPLVRSLIATKQELREATSNGKFNEEQVRALADRQGQTLSRLIIEKERVKAQIYNILTPEQRAEAEKMRSRFEAKLHERLMK